MRSKIDLRPKELLLVRSLLRTHLPNREVRAFGSRVVGTPKATSDLDLCVMGAQPVNAASLERLRSAFSDSSLPIKVDIVQWAELRDGFREIVAANSVELFPKTPRVQMAPSRAT